MKKIRDAICLFSIIISTLISVIAQSGGNFRITKSVIAGGGGTGSGGIFILNGTIGQSVAGTTSMGGAFELGGGFWGIGSNLAAPSYTVSGRVTTPTGLGLRNAIVIMTDSLGATMRATTSSFGLYSFQNVPQGTYFLGIASKRYRFATRSLSIQSDLTNVDFVGLE
ncbi:MAG: carboxypeptidase-like regulatory domain-containing protein [Pyrinomonadaceae bacterium]